VVQSYNEAKKFGMVVSDEAHKMWGQEIYVYKDVLAAANAGVGDHMRFGIHLNPRGQPQVSLPAFKVGEDGIPLNVPPGTEFMNCEEVIDQDPAALEQIKQEIEDMSQRQNKKRGAKGDPGKGKGAPKGRTGPSPAEAWGAPPPRSSSKGGTVYAAKGSAGGAWGEDHFTWGKGGGGGAGGAAKGSWGPPPSRGEVTLFVSGVPIGVPRRELMHIFRQYAGFTSLRMVERQDHSLVFATFETAAQADFVTEALNGYVFDEEAPIEEQTMLSMAPARQGKMKGGP
jgi:hypothetical protein